MSEALTEKAINNIIEILNNDELSNSEVLTVLTGVLLQVIPEFCKTYGYFPTELLQHLTYMVEKHL